MDAVAAYTKIHQQTQEALVKNHALMVKRIAYHLLMRLPKTVQLDDLIQAGMLGLLEAVRNYDADKGASFETYASIRIRGYMIDEVRRNGWVPRSVYKNTRMVSEAVKKVENRLGRESKDSEVAAELQVDLEEYYQLIQDTANSQLYALEDLDSVDEQGFVEEHLSLEPHDQVMHDDLMDYVYDLIQALPKNEALVLSLYYKCDLNLKEIGAVLEISESRVSQILTQATTRIRKRLGFNCVTKEKHRDTQTEEG